MSLAVLVRWQSEHSPCRLVAVSSPPLHRAMTWSISVAGVTLPASKHSTQSGLLRRCLTRMVCNWRPRIRSIIRIHVSLGRVSPGINCIVNSTRRQAEKCACVAVKQHMHYCLSLAPTGRAAPCRALPGPACHAQPCLAAPHQAMPAAPRPAAPCQACLALPSRVSGGAPQQRPLRFPMPSMPARF